MAFWQWSKTAASNGSIDATVNFAEGQAPGSLNDSARAVMARLAEYRDDISGLIVTSGTSTAYTLTSNQGLSSTPNDGQLIAFSPHATNGATPTLAADGGTAFPIQVSPGAAVGAAVLVLGSPYVAKFSNSNSSWILLNYFSNVIAPGTEAGYAGLVAPTGWLLEYGQAISRTTYSALFAAITLTVTGTPSNGSPTITSVGTDLRNMGVEGAYVEGTGITTGTTISSVTSNSITLSANATGGSAGETLRILPFGQGDASTTFTIPDRRGRVLAGRDNMGGTAAGNLSLAQTQGVSGTKLNASGGEQGHTVTTTEMPSHNHTTTESPHSHSLPSQSNISVTQTSPTATAYSNGSGTTGSATTGLTINNTGGGGAHNNVQPTGISNMIIKY